MEEALEMGFRPPRLLKNSDELFTQLSEKFNGVWINDPHYLLCMNNEWDDKSSCLYKKDSAKGGKIFFQAKWPLLKDNFEEVLQHCHTIFGLNQQELDYYKDKYPDAFQRSWEDFDYIFDRSSIESLSGSKFKNLRTQVNAFYRNNCRVELYDRAKHLEGCCSILSRWREEWRKRNFGFTNCTNRTLACLTHFYRFPGAFYLVALDNKDNVIGYALFWIHNNHCVSITRATIFDITGIEPALMQKAALLMPKSISDWNDGPGDLGGKLSKHKDLYRPVEKRIYYEIESLIYQEPLVKQNPVTLFE